MEAFLKMIKGVEHEWAGPAPKAAEGQVTGAQRSSGQGSVP